MRGGQNLRTRECPVCHAPMVATVGDDLIRCDKCGSEVICRISFEQRVARVALESIIRDQHLPLVSSLLIVLAACHLEYVFLRWALTTASGWVAWLAWGGVVYCGVAIVAMIVVKVVENKQLGQLQRIAEESQYDFTRFKELARCPGSGINRWCMRFYENNYESVKKWMS